MTNCENCPSAIWDCFEFYGTTKTQRIVTGCKREMEPEECEEEEDE